MVSSILTGVFSGSPFGAKIAVIEPNHLFSVPNMWDAWNRNKTVGFTEIYKIINFISLWYCRSLFRKMSYAFKVKYSLINLAVPDLCNLWIKWHI